MRKLALRIAAVLTAAAVPQSIRAADLAEVTVRAPITYPVCTEEGDCRLGLIEVWPRPGVAIERSVITGQPLTVIYNNPTSFYGAADPRLVLVPLPRRRHTIHFEGLYGRGG